MRDELDPDGPSFGAIVFDVELLGVELHFNRPEDPRGPVWIPLRSGLSVLYGRNGAGKTTILNALESSLSGIRRDDVRARLFLRLLATEREMRENDDEVRREMQARMAQWEEDVKSGTGSIEVVVDGELIRISAPPPSTPEGRRPPRGWFFQRILAAVPKGCDFFNIERAHDDAFEPHEWAHPAPQLSTVQIEAEEWADSLYPTWVDLARLLLLGHSKLDDAWRNPSGRSSAHVIRPIHPDVYAVCVESEQSRLLCCEPVGTGRAPSWNVRLAAQVVGDTAGKALLDRSTTALMEHFAAASDSGMNRHVERLVRQSGSESGRAGIVLASTVGSSLLAERAQLEISRGAGSVLPPYAPIGAEWSTVRITDLPVMARRASPSDDCTEEVNRFLGWIGHSYGEASLIVQTDHNGETEVEAVLPNVDEGNSLLREVSVRLRGAAIGISDLRVALRGGVQAALTTGMLTLEARDSFTRTWLPIDSLSSAQRSWVAFALSLIRPVTSTIPVDDGPNARWQERTVLLADEVDQGFSERSVPPLLGLLESMFPVGILATHSPAALRSNIGSLWHVYREDGGRIRLIYPTNGGAPKATAERLGISTAELLTFLQVVVLVEGEHDRVVFESLLAARHPNAMLDTQVIPFRGVRQLTAPGSRLLIDYTDAAIVVVVDGARQERIEEALANARNLGESRRTVKRLTDATHPLRRPDASSEELVLAELIQQACIQGVLNRIRVVGLEVPDVVMAFDPESFGLTRSWDEYGREWRAARREARTDLDFKAYLRAVHEAKISTNRLEAIVRHISSPPQSLWSALDEIEMARLSAALNNLD